MLGSIILIVLGILLLLNNLYPDTYRFSRVWPVILIVIGFAKLVEYFHGRNAASPASPASPIDGQVQRHIDGQADGRGEE